MDKAIQNCFDICPSSKCLGTGAVQSRADFNIRTEEVVGNCCGLWKKINAAFKKSMPVWVFVKGERSTSGLFSGHLEKNSSQKTQASEKLKPKSQKNSRKILETGLLANSETSKNKKLLEMLVVLKV